jgi:hypothetical protein
MGCCSSKNTDAFNQLAPDEKEIEFPSYISSNDKLLEKTEKVYNLFNYITLIEYINELENFSIETATIPLSKAYKTKYSKFDEFLINPISIDEFQSFLENKILKLKENYELSGNNETLANIFKDSKREIYRTLEQKLNQHYNKKDPNRILKRNLLSFGFLSCLSTNIGKIKLFFDLFSNENKFVKSDELNDFLLSIFLVSSYCLIAAAIKIGKNYNEVKKLSDDEITNGLKVMELKDNENLVEVFNKSFFEKDEYNWEEFKKKFEGENGFGWIFSSKGIRSNLEKNNV